MITFCDSCTDEKEVKEYKGEGGIPFWWCDECKEEDDRLASLPICDSCGKPTEEDEMAGSICIGCETEQEVNYWRTQ